MDKPTPEELQLLHDELCSALNDTTRIAILYELADGARNVGAMVESLGLPQGTVSRHLKVLRERGVVIATRQANQVLYELGDPRVLEVLGVMRDMLADSLRLRGETAARIQSARKGTRR
ncbi:ArsR/SmtB family transcription factor [Candidatus Eisenbacteria bacterium]|uniref:ArsR/SmtB family transcription factor n=1 Tax=Eiseniibacteriota bacterium TaxID=2212470 RepID=A0ABV6YJI5_UNCEI